MDGIISTILSFNLDLGYQISVSQFDSPFWPRSLNTEFFASNLLVPRI